MNHVKYTDFGGQFILVHYVVVVVFAQVYFRDEIMLTLVLWSYSVASEFT